MFYAVVFQTNGNVNNERSEKIRVFSLFSLRGEGMGRREEGREGDKKKCQKIKTHASFVKSIGFLLVSLRM